MSKNIHLTVKELLAPYTASKIAANIGKIYSHFFNSFIFKKQSSVENFYFKNVNCTFLLEKISSSKN